MNRLVAITWWVALLGTNLAFVPNAVSWLERAMATAQHIERYTEGILESSRKIAENTAGASALKDTLALAPHLVANAETLEKEAEALAIAVGSQGAGSASTSDGEEQR